MAEGGFWEVEREVLLLLMAYLEEWVCVERGVDALRDPVLVVVREKGEHARLRFFRGEQIRLVLIDEGPAQGLGLSQWAYGRPLK